MRHASTKKKHAPVGEQKVLQVAMRQQQEALQQLRAGLSGAADNVAPNLPPHLQQRQHSVGTRAQGLGALQWEHYG